MPITLYAMAALGIALAASLGGNYLLFKARDAAKAETATVQASYAQAQAAGKACSDGVVALQVAAQKRQQAAQAALQAASGRAAAAEAQASRTLQTAPTSKDSCVAAEALIKAKLAERGKR